LIISEFPPLFEERRAKRWNLLWRGSRDGRANTLTLISDTDGNVFGGFTPVKWENSCGNKADDSLLSFLFTLRNPYGVSVRKCALLAEAKQHAIRCESKWGGSTTRAHRFLLRPAARPLFCCTSCTLPACRANSSPTNSRRRCSSPSPTRCHPPVSPGAARLLSPSWPKRPFAHFATSAGRAVSSAISEPSILFSLTFPRP
jgi:hypothetical protein